MTHNQQRIDHIIRADHNDPDQFKLIKRSHPMSSELSEDIQAVDDYLILYVYDENKPIGAVTVWFDVGLEKWQIELDQFEPIDFVKEETNDYIQLMVKSSQNAEQFITSK